MKKLLLVTLAFIATACAGITPSNKLSQNDLSNVKKVGVYSGFDNVFHIYLKGAHSYDDVHKEIKMPDWWSLNKQAYKTVKQKLKNKEVSKIEVKTANPTTEQILAQAKAEGLDTAILVIPAYFKEPLVIKEGYGMARYTEEQKQAYLLFKIYAYDVNSGNEISSSTGFERNSETPEFDLPIDFREFFNYHKFEVEQILKTYETVISTRVAFALNEMGF